MEPQPASDQYAALIREFCQVAGIDNVASVFETGSVLVDGVPFTLYHHPTDTAEYLVLYCDFGLVPVTIMQAVLSRLLEINLFLSGAVPPSCFTLNPDNGHVLLSYRSELWQLDATKLLDCIHACVEQAQRFKQTHFLDENPADLPALSDTSSAFDAVAATAPLVRVPI
jgi:hypothetical protein